MALVNVPVTSVTKTGVVPATEVNGDATNHHTIQNLTSDTIIVARNAHATLARTVTFVTPGTVDGQAIGDRTVSVPAVSTLWFAGFSQSAYGDDLEVRVETSDIKLTAYRAG